MTRKILLVDDEPANINALSIAIEDAGFEVVPAQDGVEARNLIERGEQSIALVLLDYMMPNIDGMALLKWMRAQAKHRDLPVIMITGRVFEEDRAAALAAGAQAFISKPVDLDVLDAAIAQWARPDGT